MDDDKKDLYFDGENYYSEDDFFNSDDDDKPKPRKKTKWITITISVLLTLSLFSYVLAIYPKLFNMATIDFIKTSIELSKNEDVQLLKESVVLIKGENNKGTGFYYSNDGYIMTNYHVVNGQQMITVTFNDGKTYPATIINSDQQIDIAILKVEEDELTYPILEFENIWLQDEAVYIIGNPLYSSFIVNEGKIIALTTNNVIPILIIDAPVYKGNSGSPVINKDGRVVGVIYATTTIIFDGIEKKVGLAIPVEYIEILK